jgi:isopentenyl-diphosphate Delta-isomerase
MEQVILVDSNDVAVGTMEKQQVHVEGLLHRAISVFVFNTKNELLLQQRAAWKYHSALEWTNTCCSHPRPGESVETAAARRLKEEMGIQCTLTRAFAFEYKADLINGLTEHEYDHVFVGVSDAVPVPNGQEVADWKYMSSSDLKKQIEEKPDRFTPWFKLCIAEWNDELFNRQTNA